MMVAQVADGTTVTVSGECIRGHIERLSGIRHPNTGPRGLSAAADYIGEQLHEVGAVVSEHFFTVDGFRGKFRNVEGVINAGSTLDECLPGMLQSMSLTGRYSDSSGANMPERDKGKILRLTSVRPLFILEAVFTSHYAYRHRGAAYAALPHRS